MNWLYVTTTPWPMTNGTALRVWHMARTLHELGDSVTLLSDGLSEDAAKAYQAAGVSLIPVSAPPDEGGSRRSRFSPFDRNDELAETLARRAGEFDVAVLSAAPMLQYAPQASAASRVVVDMIDDPVLETRRRLWSGGNPARWLRRLRIMMELRAYEKRYVRGVRLVTFVSDADAHSFGRRRRGVEVAVVPNGVDLEYFSPGAAESEGPGSACSRVIFVGNFKHQPNEDAAWFLAREIAPLVWQECPEAEFFLVGPNPSDRMRAQENRRVRVTGLVDDIRPYLLHASVVLLPMRTGTGIKNKLLEAWAAQRAVVATPLACQGTPARDGHHLPWRRCKSARLGNGEIVARG